MIPRQKSWLPPPHHLEAKTDEVHIWRAYLDVTPRMLRKLRSVLSEDERQRASHFHFQSDSDHYSVGRAVLRDILSRYLKTSAQAIVFSYNQYGKPSLSEEAGKDALSFNVTHSNGIALYAITMSRAVGIDIEFIRKDIDALKIAEQFFSPAEISVLRTVPDELKTLAFFNCWTHKEAYIKARGEGISIPLNNFTVPFMDGDSTRIINTDNDLKEDSPWSFFKLYPGEAYAAALAVEGHLARLSTWQWPAPIVSEENQTAD